MRTPASDECTMTMHANVPGAVRGSGRAAQLFDGCVPAAWVTTASGHVWLLVWLLAVCTNLSKARPKE